MLDLSNELLSPAAIECLADLLAIDFGLKKLTMESCGLDDDSLKPLLHALLVSGSVPTISLANNKRIRLRGWKLIAIFVSKARFLRYLDVSEMALGRKEAELLVQALARKEVTSPLLGRVALPSVPIPTQATTPTRPTTPPVDATPPASPTRPSDLGLSLADSPNAPDSEGEEDIEPIFTSAPLLSDSPADSPAGGAVFSMRFENCNLKGQALEALAHGVRSSSLKHISLRRNKINALGAVALAIMIRDYALAPESSTGSALQAVSPNLEITNPLGAAANGHPAEGPEEEGTRARAAAERDAWQNSEARHKLRKQIEELPRTGSLLTLDIKGNDIRVSRCRPGASGLPPVLTLLTASEWGDIYLASAQAEPDSQGAQP